MTIPADQLEEMDRASRTSYRSSGGGNFVSACGDVRWLVAEYRTLTDLLVTVGEALSAEPGESDLYEDGYDAYTEWLSQREWDG